MNNLKVIISAILICLFFSFKSEKQNLGVNQSVLNRESTFSDSINFDAVLSTNHSKILGKNHVPLPYLNSTIANFYDNTNGGAFSRTNFVPVNSVSINDSILAFDSGTGTYYDSLFRAYPTPIVWNVVGAATIPSFTFTNNNDIPSYNGYNLLPDTLLSGQDISITVSDFNNADKAQIWLLNTDNKQMIKRTVDNTGIVTFSQSSDLIGFFSQNTNVVVVIYFSNYNIQTISGKKINFVNNFSLFKNIVFMQSDSSDRNSSNNNNRVKK